MAESRPKTWSPEVLAYSGGGRKDAGKVRRHYLLWRQAQDPPLPPRCDNEECRFHADPLVWNGKPLPLILDHKNGVNTDNSPNNLRFLCPNCDSQNGETRGGANRGRVRKSSGGFATRGPQGWSYVLPAGSGVFRLDGKDAEMTAPRDSEPSPGRSPSE